MVNCYTYIYTEDRKQVEITVFKTLYGWQAVSKYGILWDKKEQVLKNKMETKISAYWQAEELNKKHKKLKEFLRRERDDRNCN